MTPTNTAVTEHPTPDNARVTLAGDREVRIERIVNASRQRVWDAFTKPELLAQWWGRGNRVVVERFELEVGGHWRFVEHTEQGTYGFEGRYGEITPPTRLVASFEWDGMPTHVVLNTTEFEDLGDGRTRLVTTSLYLTAQDRDGMMSSGMESGLNESYRALDRLLATNA